MTETINHPKHYKSKRGPEAIDVIEAFELNFNLGNTIKYILRAGKKSSDNTEDLKKALWYLNKEIDKKQILEGKIKTEKTLSHKERIDDLAELFGTLVNRNWQRI